jgi:crotonobetainyl-CoA:carnitine CoA-transferase CaiB-like acyl-CoA transferase
MMSWDLMLALRLKVPVVPYDREHAVNPIVNCFQAKDGRWFWLLLLQADRHWPDLLRAVGRPDILEDERWKDISIRRANAAQLVAELDGEFAKRTLEEWGAIFERENVWWAPVNSISQALEDPAARASGAFAEIAGPDGPVPTVNTPADFYGTPGAPRGLAPELGQHTEEVLLELGYDWDRIIALKESGAIP